MSEIRFQDKDFSNAQLTEIALLHRAGIPNGFLSSFSVAFLLKLYKAISTDPYSNLTTARDSNGGPCLGFIAGTTDILSMYRRVIMRHGFSLAIAFLSETVRVSFLRKCIETLAYPLVIAGKWHVNQEKKGRSSVSGWGELLSIVVSDKARKKGIGKSLVNKIELFFKRKGVSSYRVVTFSGDSVSNMFYSALSFQRLEPLSLHGNILNTYCKKLK